MNKKQRNELKKTMTKKQYLELVRKERSRVTEGMNLGTISMKCKKDYCRADIKRETRKMCMAS